MSNIMEKLELTAQSMYCKKIEELTASELHLALGKAVMGEIAPDWTASKAKHNSYHSKSNKSNSLLHDQ